MLLMMRPSSSPRSVKRKIDYMSATSAMTSSTATYLSLCGLVGGEMLFGLVHWIGSWEWGLSGESRAGGGGWWLSRLDPGEGDAECLGREPDLCFYALPTPSSFSSFSLSELMKNRSIDLASVGDFWLQLEKSLLQKF